MEKNKQLQPHRKQHKKKEKKPFWKQFGPEIESITTHIGKAADNMTHSQWSDIALNGLLAYLSFDAFAPQVHVASYKVITQAPNTYDGTYSKPEYPDQIAYFEGKPQDYLTLLHDLGYKVVILKSYYSGLGGEAPTPNVVTMTLTDDQVANYPSAVKVEGSDSTQKQYSFGQWPNALFGPISLKLATSMGGTPPVAQIAGLAGLVMLGFQEFNVPEDVAKAIESQVSARTAQTQNDIANGHAWTRRWLSIFT